MIAIVIVVLVVGLGLFFALALCRAAKKGDRLMEDHPPERKPGRNIYPREWWDWK